MILITGGAGYIGSHVVIKFIENNYDILIFDNLENGHMETIESLKKIGSVTFEKGDLRNIEDIDKVFAKYKIDGVLHFAAFALVGESVENPAKYYRNNCLGTLNLIDTLVKYGCNKIVFSSTCATYGNLQYTPIDENHPQNPINPYGASKLMVERMLKDYDKAYGLKSVILRYFNVAGADSFARVGEWHNPETHLVPNILKSVVDKTKLIKVFGTDYDTPDGTCIRDYVNVEDLANAHMLAFKYLVRENTSNIFNLGTENGDSVKHVLEVCEDVLNQKLPVEIADRRPGDPPILFANAKKAKNILGWTPQKTLKDSISSAYEWEKKLNN